MTVKVAFAVAPTTVAGWPLMVSLVNALPGLVLIAAVVPALKPSFVATIGVGRTVTVTVVMLSQLVAFNTSHNL